MTKDNYFLGKNPSGTYSVNLNDNQHHTMEMFDIEGRNVLRFNNSNSTWYISLCQTELDSVVNFLKMYNGGKDGN